MRCSQPPLRRASLRSRACRAADSPSPEQVERLDESDVRRRAPCARKPRFPSVGGQPRPQSRAAARYAGAADAGASSYCPRAAHDLSDGIGWTKSRGRRKAGLPSTSRREMAVPLDSRDEDCSFEHAARTDRSVRRVADVTNDRLARRANTWSAERAEGGATSARRRRGGAAVASTRGDDRSAFPSQKRRITCRPSS